MKAKRTGILLSYDTAMCAGRDAGNRSMRAAGRKVWNDEDYNACVARVEHLVIVLFRSNHPAVGERKLSKREMDQAFYEMQCTRGYLVEVAS